MDLGERLRGLRKARKLTQEDVAGSLHVSRQALSRWENGSACPDSENLVRLAELLCVPLDELVGNRPHQNEPVASPGINQRVFQPIAAYTGFVIASRIQTNAEGYVLYIAVLTVIAGTLMGWNIWRDRNLACRSRNARIELGYCLVVYLVMQIGTPVIGNVLSGLVVIACCMVYLHRINPRLMGRRIFR